MVYSSVADWGWVLWTSTEFLGEKDKLDKEVAVDTSRKWEPDDGFDQLAACRRALTAAFDDYEKSAAKAKSNSPND